MNITPTADPLPWITQIMARAGAFAVTEEHVGEWYYDESAGAYKRGGKPRRVMTGQAAAAVLDVLTQAVSALHDDAKPYIVLLDPKHATAATMLERRVVQVGSRPMNDEALTDGQRAAVMAGLALHEVGHIRYARQYSAAVTKRFPGAITGAIRTISNIAADLHDETEACRVFPGLAPAVAVTLWWVGNKGRSTGRKVSEMLRTSAAERVNAAINATRYPWQVEWDTVEARQWREWWTEWAERATHADSPKDHAEMVAEGIAKIREINFPEGNEPPIIDEPIGPTRKREDGEKPDETQPGGRNADDKPEDEQPKDEPNGKGNDPEDGKDEGSEKKGDQGPQGPSKDDGEEAESEKNGETEGEGEGQGARAGDVPEGKPYDANENAPTEDPCPKEAAADRRSDATLQKSVEGINRGKREGARRRHYTHASSYYGSCGGHSVVAYPRKGKRWVLDV